MTTVTRRIKRNPVKTTTQEVEKPITIEEELGFSLSSYEEEDKKFKLLKKSVEAKKKTILAYMQDRNSSFIEEGECFVSLTTSSTESIDLRVLRDLVKNDAALWGAASITKKAAEGVTNAVNIAKASKKTGEKVVLKASRE